MTAKIKKAPTPGDNGPPPVGIQEKIALAEAALNTAMVEREEEVRLTMVGLFAGEHCLFVGPPGTAKSHLLDSLMRWMSASKFDILMTKFTTPEEVCGPISVPAMKREEYYRITAGMFPEAHVAFLDEIWKASSAILNTLLKVLNERRYKNGTKGNTLCPLLMCMAASNEWPNENNGGQELGALFDRFLLRKVVRPVSDSGMKRLLRKAINCESFEASFPHTITPAEVLQGRKEALHLPWSNSACKALWDIRTELGKQGIKPGDRRTIKAINVARAAAYVDGASEVQPQHLEVLQHVLWDDPTEQPDKCMKIVVKLANPLGARVNDLLVQAQEVNDQGAAQLREGGRDNMTVVAEAMAKLDDIERELGLLQDSPRRRQALDYVQDQLKAWRQRSIGRRVQED